MEAVLSFLLSLSLICQYLLLAPNVEKTVALPSRSKSLSIPENGYESRFVAVLRLRYSTQSQSKSSFLKTKTMEATKSGCPSSMMFSASILIISPFFHFQV